MINLFLELLNRSIQAGYLMIAIMILRLLWKHAPRLLYRVLWCLAGIRLIVPFTLESVFSLIPKKTVIEPEILYSAKPAVDSGITVVNQVINPVISKTFAPDTAASVNPLQIAAAVAAVIWLAGMGCLLLYGVISYIRLHYRMADAVLWKENIYQSEKIVSPFVFGFIRPRIYLPYSIEQENLHYVVAHEKAHIRRCDHLLKPLAFVLLAVYWFNPLLWIGYYLFCKDLELACDEAVISDMELSDKKAYSKALVSCSTGRRLSYVSPLAFGENGVRKRVQNILNYKKPTVWIGIITAAVIVIAIFGFLTSPKEEEVVVLPNEEIVMTVTPNETDGFHAAEHHNDSTDNAANENNAAVSIEDGAVPVLLKEPPAVSVTDTLSSQINEFRLERGAFSWTYIDAELTEEGIYDFTNGNRVGTEATGLFPTSAAKMTEWLKLPDYQNKKATWLYRFNCEVLPDKVTVREYSIFELGNEEAEIRSEKTYTKDMLILEIIPGRIYEITAVWDESHFEECGYYGDASYILVTDTEFATEEDVKAYQSRMMNTVTIDAHIKEIHDGNTILISSDTDDFPGAFEVVIPKQVYDIDALYGGQTIRVEMYDTGAVNENGRIPIYTAVGLRELIIEEPEEFSLDDASSTAAYEVNTLDGVTLQMEKYSNRGGDVEICNTTDMNIEYGEWYEIQVLVHDKWYALPYIVENAAFHQPAYQAKKDETVIWEVDWSWLYGELPKGTYRIVKDVMDFRGTGDYTKYYLADEFEIK